MANPWNKAIQQTAAALAATVTQPDEQMIGGMLSVYAKPLGLDCDSPEFQAAVRRLRSRFLEKIPEGTTLTDDEETAWSEWLPAMRDPDRMSTQVRWLAYYRYLQEEQGAETVQLQALDKSTERVLGLLSDPRRDHPAIPRKGLVLGDVQSGKTRTYMALMNKAVDCGYKLVIVLTSSDENLRSQTQERVNSDFIGFDFARKKTGVGKYLTQPSTVIPLTNEDDFIKAYSNAFMSHPRPGWDRGPVVAVMKKNGSVLAKFNRWLDDPEFPKDLPVLVIDDESDYASVNSAKAEDSPTRINSLICELCRISERTSYVAVTATPFANVFIDDEIEKDLFPKDFIHILPTPPAYIGAKKLFGDLDDTADNPCVRELEWEKDGELDEWLPLSHKKDYRFPAPELDPQVSHAIDCFLVACALRPNASRKRQSMLLHLSRFTAVQQQIADMVNDYLGDLTNALNFHATDGDPRIRSLHRAYDDEYAEYGRKHGITWPDVLFRLRALTSRLQVRLVNSDAKDWSFAHQVQPQLADDECTIYVGGNQISRGMTLDGLICSVFYRNVTSADTLLQMGRWFGYRPGYEQLQRIWLLERSVYDFRYACSIVEDIKDTARKMSRYGMTPRQLGFSIQGNPQRGVRITSASKMRNATKTNGPIEVFDLSNQVIESVRIGVDHDRLKANDEALSLLLDRCMSDGGVAAGVSRPSNAKVFRNVPDGFVIDFLSQYRAGYGDAYFGPTLTRYRDRKPLEGGTTMMEQFAKSRHANFPDTTWTVAFINGGGTPVVDFPFEWRQAERTSDFDTDHNLWRISGRNMRLGGKSDFLQVANLLHPGIQYSGGSEKEYYLTEYFGDDPVLMLYSIHVKPGRNSARDLAYAPAAGRGLLGAKVIIPTDHYVDKGGKASATYYINTVGARLMYELQRQEEEDDEE